MTVEARWRRLKARIDDLDAAVDISVPDGPPDAAAGALDALYDLWEGWRAARKALGVPVRVADDDRAVAGDPDGETTAALVYARGGKTHDLIEFGDLTDTFSDTFRDTFGCWRWGTYADVDERYRLRCAWYAEHVAGQELLDPFERALAWLQAQPEVAP